MESFATTQAQLELARALLVPLPAQPEAFADLVQRWNAAYLRLLEATAGPASAAAGGMSGGCQPPGERRQHLKRRLNRRRTKPNES